MSDWNFFTNYGHVLFVLAQNADITIREVSIKVGITERRAQKIISQLIEDGYLKATKVGRNNRYKIVGRKKLKHPVEDRCSISDLIEIIAQA